jgi:hypothetical protein
MPQVAIQILRFNNYDQVSTSNRNAKSAWRNPEKQAKVKVEAENIR